MSTALRILVRHGNDNYGPYSVAEVNSMLASGRVRPDYLAWVEGEPAWRQLHTVPGVLPGPGSSAPPPPPPPAPGYGAAPPASDYGEVSDRLVLPAFLLAFFLGVFGVHRFYVGKTGSGIAMIVLTCTGIGLIVTGIWATVDWIMIVCGAFRDERERPLRQWT
ncbi:MAG: NINE protein [Planctomycetes bacterium]|nr:NINE protein [Planctomycetota bacterium]